MHCFLKYLFETQRKPLSVNNEKRIYLIIARIHVRTLLYVSILSAETLKNVVWAIFGTRRLTDAYVRCPFNFQHGDDYQTMTLSKRKYRNVVSTWNWKKPRFSFILQILKYLTLFKKCYWQVWLEWTEHQFRYFSFFSECMPGYSGLNCTTRCPYPLYGYICQGYCD